MSRETLSIPPVLAFADPAGELWGVAVGEGDTLLATGPLDRATDAAAAATLEAGGAPDTWTLSAASGSLSATAEPAGVSVPDADGGLALVRISGSLLGDEEAPAAAGGVRHPGWPDLQADSVRLLCAWFSPERAMAFLAVRPSRAKGQDRDELSAICIGERDGMIAFDPRLSTTYGEDYVLRRVGVELWLGENEEADMYSLRMAGEATGSAATLPVDGARVQAQPFRCHSRGETGVGVYVLISRS